jgi:hypothetical protein
MAGQPVEFEIVSVIPTETTTSGGVDAPSYILEANDTLTLKTYCHCGGGVVIRRAVNTALTSAGAACEYFFLDLEVGGIPQKFTAVGSVHPLDATEIAAALGPGGDLEGRGLPLTGDYYLWADTAPITTSNDVGGGTLKPPAGEDVGTWFVLTHVHGNVGSGVTAFLNDMLIQVQA